MRAIQAAHLHESGAEVTNLHEGLLSLIRRQPGISDETRAVLEKQLAPDLGAQRFGTATAGLVGIFQYQLKRREDLPKEVKARFKNLPLLPTDAGTGNGDVDDLTAEALNWLLKEVGAFK
jgi:hypothetical protein